MRLIARLDTPVKQALVAAALAFGVWLAATGLFFPTLQTIDELSGDWIWRLTASDTSERRIILVDIDEASLQELGPWPWSRMRLAELSDRLATEGAALQVFDLVLAAPAAGDEKFASALARNTGVLAQVFALEPNTGAAIGQPVAPLPWAACPAQLPQALGYIGNPPAYATTTTGHITPLVERQGIIRRQPALICHQGKAYPALFIAALAKINESDDIRLQAGSDPSASSWQLLGPFFDKHGIPLDSRGNVRIPWSIKPDAFVSIAARDILAGRVPRDLLKNSWVVVGSTALGLNDRIATPFGGHGAGFTIHAQLLRGAIDDRLPIEPAEPWLYSGLAAAAAVLLLIGAGRLPRTPVWFVPLVAIALAASMAGLKILMLQFAGLWLPWIEGALFILLFALSQSFVGYAQNRLERERLYRHLSSYLPGPVAAILARQDPSDSIDAERATVTVLYADIRNFSAYCESRPADEAAAVLHAFFSMATRVVEQHGGTIEAFQGDAVLAVWGVPAADPGNNQHAESALASALAILKGSHALLPQELPDDLAPLAVGIGLETGLATVGSFGLARRRTHLAMGRAVTAAARLQEMTVELAHPILLGEGIAAALGPHRLESQGVFLLEGLKLPCHLYAYPLAECV